MLINSPQLQAYNQFPTYQGSFSNTTAFNSQQLLNENQELHANVNRLSTQLQEMPERFEFLQEDSIFNRLLIFSQNSTIATSSLYSLFFIEDIIIISLPEQFGNQPFFLINVKIGAVGKKSILIKETDLNPNRLPTLFRKIGATFVCKRSDRRKGELMADYISYKLQHAKIIFLPYLAGWFFLESKPCFIDASNDIFRIFSENRFKLPSRKKWLIKSEVKSPINIIESYWNRSDFLSQPASIIISLFFHLSLLQGVLEKAGCWNLDKFLYIQVTDTSIGCEKISQASLQVFNNNEPSYKTLDMPSKDIINSVITMQDEIFIIKADNPTFSKYKQDIRLDNFRTLSNLFVNRDSFKNNGQDFKSRSTLACISNQNIADLPMNDALSVYIGREDINIKKLQEALRNPQIVGNYVNLLCQYISSNFDTVISLLTETAKDSLQTGLKTFEENGIAYSIFMTVYELLVDFTNHYHLKFECLWGTRDELEKLLISFLYQNEASNIEGIPEFFMDGLGKLISDCTLINRLSNDILLEGSNITIYCDDNFLYIFEQDLREYIIPYIFHFHITVNQLLKSLSAAEIITSDQTRVNTYLKTVYFPKQTPPSQKKMVAINRSRIWSLGDDIYD